MKKELIFVLTAILAGCATQKQYNDYADLPNSTMLVDKEMSALSRSQIISAIQECQSGNLRPVLIYSKRKINGQVNDTVVDVSCAPKFGQ